MVKKTGRSPIHKSGDVRANIWKLIRELKSFRLFELEDKTRVNQRTILSYLEGLMAAGIVSKEIVEIEGKGALKHSTYTLIKDSGVDAPRVRKDGSMVPETSQNRMWKAIRVLKTFDLQTIIVTASTEKSVISPTAADTYLRQLKKAGYLIKKPQEKTYKLNLAMNYGSKAPQIQKINQIYDPNIKKVVWSDGGDL